jgi:hypothetical protein
MHKETAQKQTLADLIFAKLKEGEEARDGEQVKAERSQAAEEEINPKVVQVYEK